MTISAITELLQPPSRRSIVRVLAGAILAGALSWYFGADVWHSILLGSAVATIAVIGLIGSAVQIHDTNWRHSRRNNRGGSRNDVAELSWSLRGSWGRVSPQVMWRVTRIARQRLAAHHLDLSNPRDQPKIEQLIGRRSYALLVRPERRPPLLRSLLRCLDELDALAARAQATTPAVRR